MDDFFVIGGTITVMTNSNRRYHNHCFSVKFDTKIQTWNEVNKMKRAIYNASCTLFEGKIVFFR